MMATRLKWPVSFLLALCVLTPMRVGSVDTDTLCPPGDSITVECYLKQLTQPCPPLCQEPGYVPPVTITAPTVMEECNRTMEAAMRAMEPFLTSSLHLTPEAERDRYQHERYLAFTMWADTKRACWREP